MRIEGLNENNKNFVVCGLKHLGKWCVKMRYTFRFDSAIKKIYNNNS